MNIREAINKNPLVGWGVAAVALAAAAVFAVTRGGDSDGPLTDKVTILFTDTNEKIEMRRGELEMKLLERAGPVDATKGIINPATNQPTGVILNEGDWKRTVEKLNAMKAAAAAQSKSGGNGNTAAPKPR
jgi:hypothetical protein